MDNIIVQERNKKWSPFLTLCLLVLSCGLCRSQNGPINLDFENAVLIDTVHHTGWFPPAKSVVPDYTVQLSTEEPSHGKQCAQISSIRPPNGREFGNLMQSFDAKPFQGKTIRFRAAVKVVKIGRAHV